MVTRFLLSNSIYRTAERRVAGALLALLAACLLAVPAAADTLAQGTWTKKNYTAKGTWQILQEDGKTVLTLDEAFETKKAPDLKIFLSPLSVDELKNGNALDGALQIAPLKSSKGAQTYPLPQEIDLGSFKTVIIHCEQYTKLWVAAPLRGE